MRDRAKVIIETTNRKSLIHHLSIGTTLGDLTLTPEGHLSVGCNFHFQHIGNHARDVHEICRILIISYVGTFKCVVVDDPGDISRSSGYMASIFSETVRDTR